MKYILLLVQILGYKILDYTKPSINKDFNFCPLIDKTIIDNAFLITNDIRFTINYNFIYKNHETAKLTICNENSLIGRGHTTTNSLTNKQNIVIDNTLLTYKYNLYNVLYHEFGHVMGLDHSDKQGIMNYSLIKDIHDNIIDDTFNIWLSQDDINGIKYISNIVP